MSNKKRKRESWEVTILDGKEVVVKWSPQNKNKSLYDTKRTYEVVGRTTDEILGECLILAPIGSLVPPRLLPFEKIKKLTIETDFCLEFRG
ncbi:hypothetical protein KKA27_02215 [Patescibacteria group bacterium]|nr:hypothetical protein [Patescibacteria group bacterium]MBU2633418.1 hypothetical protein [Patescibacteria group bacterium]